MQEQLIAKLLLLRLKLNRAINDIELAEGAEEMAAATSLLLSLLEDMKKIAVRLKYPIFLQEITLPRKEGRPPYITQIARSDLTLIPLDDQGASHTLSISLTDEQWAEYAEIPLGEFLELKAEAMVVKETGNS